MRTILPSILALLIPHLANAQSVTLPTGYQKTYDFTPTSVAQIVQHGSSSDGSTISYTNWTHFQGSGDDASTAAIATIQGVQALQISATDIKGIALSTLGDDFKGYSFAPPWYVECKEYFPAEGKGWDQVVMAIGVDTDSNWTEYDFPEVWGNLACAGKTIGESNAINHNHAQASPDYSSIPSDNYVPLPASGDWSGAWHTFSVWVTPATGDPNNPGTATFYVDGVPYRIMRAPTDPVTGVPYWNRKSFAIWSLLSATDNGSSTFNCATNNSPYVGYLAYLRVWTTNGTPVPSPSPSPSSTPSPSPSSTPSPSPSPSSTPQSTPSPSPSSTPTPQPTGTPLSTPTPQPSSTPEPTVTPTPTPGHKHRHHHWWEWWEQTED